MARPLALAAAIAISLLLVSGAGGAGAQTPKSGGTLVLAAPASPLFQEPPCLSLLDARCYLGLTTTIAPKVLEAPFDIGPDLTWRPRLVWRWTFTRAAPFTLTYHVRPGASWSDGVPVSARDFVFTHNLRQKLGDQNDWHRAQVLRVRAVDARTVSIVLRSRLAGWQGALFGSVLPAHALRDADLTQIWRDGIDNPRTGEPIGSGPFLVKSWARGNRLTLVRNPRYWGGRAHLDRLVFRFGLSGDSLAAAFEGKTIDLAWGLPPGDIPRLQQLRGLGLATTPGSSLDQFWIRIGAGGHPALKHKLVRRALAFAIDRARLVRQVLDHPDADVADSAVFPAQSRYYKPHWGSYRFKPALARSLLSRAGCRRGSDGIFQCAGQRLRLRFVTTGIVGGYRLRMLELLPVQLRMVGIELVSTHATVGAYFGQVIPSGAFDLALHSVPLGPFASARLFFGCGESENSAGYCQWLVTRDLQEAERILAPVQQARVLNRADERIARDVPVIPFVQMPQSAVYAATVRGFGLRVNAQANFLWNAENWWRAEPR